MSEEQMKNEKLYQATMSMVRRMLEHGIISEAEARLSDSRVRPVIHG